MSKIVITDEMIRDAERQMYYESTFKFISDKYFKQHIDYFKNIPEYRTDPLFKEYIDRIDSTDINDL